MPAAFAALHTERPTARIYRSFFDQRRAVPTLIHRNPIKLIFVEDYVMNWRPVMDRAARALRERTLCMTNCVFLRH